MPITPTYPGVYIEELPSGVRTITGVSTSVTGFIGRARRGPVDDAVTINNFTDYERIFGGLWEESSMSYAVQQYFLNGGSQAVIVRVFNDALDSVDPAVIPISEEGGVGTIELVAVSHGSWGSALMARVDYNTIDATNSDLFNLKIKDTATGLVEVHLNLSASSTDTRFIVNVLAEESRLVQSQTFGTIRPALTMPAPAGVDEFGPPGDSNAIPAGIATDGEVLTFNEIEGSGLVPKTGLHAFDAVDIINLLCVPPYTVLDIGGLPEASIQGSEVLNGDVEDSVRTSALAYAKGRRAMFIVDSPSRWVTKDDPDLDALGLARDANAVIYFPRILSPDRLQEGRIGTFVPCGAVAGLMARTDAQRGVWKAPAGIEAGLVGVPALSVQLTDAENGELNPLGINCLRTFKGVGRVAWGARTMRGADNLADQWKYLPVRRLALFLEESLYRGSQWAVFEPNDEPLWAQVRLNFGAFMHNLFRQGAFQGASPKDAYLVKCDSETTTQNDINQGIVNIVVGFAPLKPAEFVIIKIQQLAGQVEA